MKELYLDIMEKSLAAYTSERIRDYIDEVKRDGLREHGFPRLGCNIGILIAYGRRVELMDTFIEIMDICCEQMPTRKAGNDFTVREVCCCLKLLEEKGTVSKEHIEKWKSQIKSFDPWKYYTEVDDHSGKFWANWVLFAAVSEYTRGVYCGLESDEFFNWQLPSQLANLDENDMYMDDPPYSCHTVYDLVPRSLIAFLLLAGYKGKYAERLEKVLDKTAELTLKMQSPTGELAFGGRSNQFIHNETWLASYCDMEATRFYKKGDIETARKLKAAALLAAKAALKHLSLDPISHIKNHYDISEQIGCEDYAYFNKYMITAASNAYPGILFGDESITPSVAPALGESYVIRTSENFHKTFVNAGGYQIELDTNADFRYDANGLGRVHKAECSPVICLSHPFPSHPNFILEKPNPTAMSLCCYKMIDGRIILGAEKHVRYTFTGSESSDGKASAEFTVNLTNDIAIKQRYTVSESGVDIISEGADGMMLPVFSFDGKNYTDIDVKNGEITVKYDGSYCKYTFEGTAEEYKTYYNRNGRYRAFRIGGEYLHIEMGEINEI